MATKFQNGIDVNKSVTTTAVSATDSPLAVKAAFNQSANLVEFRDAANNPMSQITSNGGLSMGTGTLISAGNGRGLFIVSSDAVVLTARGASSQSVRLQEWQNSSGTVLAGITSAGAFGTSNRLTVGSITINTSGMLHVSSTSDQVLSVVRGIGASGSPTQTTDLQQWQTFNGTAATTVSAIGAGGAVQFPYLDATSTGNLALTAYHYTVNYTSGSYTVTLPSATTTASAAGVTGRIYNIKNSGIGIITIARSGTDTIDGSTSITIDGSVKRYQTVTVQSTGSGWIII